MFVVKKGNNMKRIVIDTLWIQLPQRLNSTANLKIDGKQFNYIPEFKPGQKIEYQSENFSFSGYVFSSFFSNGEKFIEVYFVREIDYQFSENEQFKLQYVSVITPREYHTCDENNLFIDGEKVNEYFHFHCGEQSGSSIKIEDAGLYLEGKLVYSDGFIGPRNQYKIKPTRIKYSFGEYFPALKEFEPPIRTMFVEDIITVPFELNNKKEQEIKSHDFYLNKTDSDKQEVKVDNCGVHIKGVLWRAFDDEYKIIPEKVKYSQRKSGNAFVKYISGVVPPVGTPIPPTTKLFIDGYQHSVFPMLWQGMQIELIEPKLYLRGEITYGDCKDKDLGQFLSIVPESIKFRS